MCVISKENGRWPCSPRLALFPKETARSRLRLPFCERKVSAFDANVVIIKGKYVSTIAVTTWWGVLIAFELALESS